MVGIMEQIREIWKDIPGAPLGYQVSDLGRVIGPKNKILKVGKTPGGYLSLGIWNKGKATYIDVHILVARLFVPNPNNYKYVNHINGIKTDCRATNVEWCTAKENTAHARKTGLINDYGENSKNSKLTEAQVREIRNSSLSNRELGLKFNIHKDYVSLIKNRKRWQHLA